MKDAHMSYTLDYDSLRGWIDVLQTLGMAVLAVFGWQVKRDKSQDSRLEALEKLFAEKVAEHEARLAVIDEKMKHVPSSKETAALGEQIVGLSNVVTALQRAVERQNEFLLNNK